MERFYVLPCSSLFISSLALALGPVQASGQQVKTPRSQVHAASVRDPSPLLDQSDPDGDADGATSVREASVRGAKASGGGSSRKSRAAIASDRTASVDWASTPRFGGTTVVTETYAVEVVVQSRGKVKAWVSDRARKAVNPAQLKVAVEASAQPRAAVANLRWDSLYRVFTGYLPPDSVPSEGPLVVRIDDGKRREMGRRPACSPLPPPRRGGFVISVGNAAIEVVPRQAATQLGAVEAYPATLATEQSAPKMDLKLSLPDQNGEPLLVSLPWNGSAGLWRVTLPAGVAFGSGPIDVVMRAQTQTYRGGFASARPMPTPLHGGKISLAGPYAVEFLIRPNGSVQAWVFDEYGRIPAWNATQLAMNAHDVEGNVYPLPLNWQLAARRYEGRAPLPARQIAWVDVKIRKNLSTAYAPEAYWPGAVEWLGARAETPRAVARAQSGAATPGAASASGATTTPGTSSTRAAGPDRATRARPADNTLPAVNTTRPPDLGSTGWWY